MKYTEELIEKVLIDFKNGKNKCQLSRDYNISRGTIRYWIDNQDKIFNNEYYKYNKKDKPIETIIQEIKNKKEIYSYILGLYLGDGCISESKMSYKLRIAQDNKYPQLIEIIKEKLNSFFTNNVFVCNPKGCKQISIHDKNLPLYFPQHAAGKKHNRKIELVDYQRENLDYKEFLKGLWVTDGSFYKTARGYEAYNFTNKSTDIIALFEECLNNFGIKYRKRMKKNEVWIVEITKKSEVVKMKEIVGMKS
jgi:DNA-binding transcriptional regulator WhiA